MADPDDFDVEAARAQAVADLENDPDHRVSLTHEQNVACEHGDAEHGHNDQDEMLVDPPADEPADQFVTAEGDLA